MKADGGSRQQSGNGGYTEQRVENIESMAAANEDAMTTLEVILELPGSLAKEAQQAGLFTPEQLERLVREALRAKRVERLSEVREKLAAEPLPPMTPEEIQAEIDAYRAQVRRASGT
jgi:hypothetical protein